MRELDQRIAQLAQRQHQVFSREQAVDLGASAGMLQHRLRSGRWERVLSGVYGLPGGRPSSMRDLWISHLGTGPSSVVSHESAAALHGFVGFPRGRRILTVDHSSWHRIPDTFVHQISDLVAADCSEIWGLPITRPARTFVDLAATTSGMRLASALDDAAARGVVSVVDVARVLLRVARPGKPGVRKLKLVLRDRMAGFIPAESELERRFFAVVERAGLPAPKRQFTLPGRLGQTGRVDAAYPDQRVIIELDGRRWHTRINDVKRDRQWDNQAASAGWVTLRFLWEDVVNDPDHVVAVLRETIAQRIRALSTQ